MNNFFKPVMNVNKDKCQGFFKNNVIRQKQDVTLLINLDRCFKHLPRYNNAGAFTIEHNVRLSLGYIGSFVNLNQCY